MAMTRGYKRFLMIISVLLVVFAMSSCGGSRKLTREVAEGLIRPQLDGIATIRVPVGEWGDFLQYNNPEFIHLIEIFKERGILHDNAETRTFRTVTGFVGTQTLHTLSLTDKFKQFSRPGQGGLWVPLVVATQTFGTITGLRELDQGRSAEVEFSWGWLPNEVGKLLDRATLPYGGQPLKIEFRAFSFPEKAKCALYDDGWRCEVSNVSKERSLVP